MKLFAIIAFAAVGLLAQTPDPVPGVVPVVTPVVVTASISDQGSDVIRQTTGQTTKLATLIAVRACNETDADVNVSVSRLYREIEQSSQAKPVLYSSEVVSALLDVFQQRDIYNRLFKAGVAATQVATILTTAFKVLTPAAATAIQVGIPVFQAILPVIHDPRDLRDLSRQILQENTTLVLSKRDCRTGLAVARAPKIASEKIPIQ